MWNYWKRVHEEAWRVARQMTGASIVSALIATVTVVGMVTGLIWVGSYDAAADRVAEGVVTLIVSVVAMLLLYLYWIVGIPAKWDKEKVAEIKALYEIIEPRFDFRPDNSFWTEQQTVNSRTYSFLNFCIGIENKSNTTIHDVCVELDRMVVGPSIQRPRRKLRLRDRDACVFDLLPHKTEYVVIAKVNIDLDGSPLELQLEDRRPTDNLPPGEYKMKLKAYAREGRPINRFFPISVKPGHCSLAQMFYEGDGKLQLPTPDAPAIE